MQITVERPSRPERELIRRMMELYLHDFSEFEGNDLNEHAVFGYGDLDYFWFEETHAAFLVRVDGQLGGFALVDNEVVIDGNERSLTEFFVLRKYRRRGVGRMVARRIFDELPGKWEVRVIAAKERATTCVRAGRKSGMPSWHLVLPRSTAHVRSRRTANSRSPKWRGSFAWPAQISGSRRPPPHST